LLSALHAERKRRRRAIIAAGVETRRRRRMKARSISPSAYCAAMGVALGSSMKKGFATFVASLMLASSNDVLFGVLGSGSVGVF
jgi:hypothetical protein